MSTGQEAAEPRINPRALVQTGAVSPDLCSAWDLVLGPVPSHYMTKESVQDCSLWALERLWDIRSPGRGAPWQARPAREGSASLAVGHRQV